MNRATRQNLRVQDQASIDAMNAVSEALNNAVKPEAPFTLPPSPIRLAQVVATAAVAVSLRTLTAHLFVGLNDIADAIHDSRSRPTPTPTPAPAASTPEQQYTPRGFALTEITVTDYPGQQPRVLTIQESSLATEHKVWLGDKISPGHGEPGSRFHLSEEDARQVRDALTRFLGEDTDSARRSTEEDR